MASIEKKNGRATRTARRRRKGTGSLWIRNGQYYARWRENGRLRSRSLGIEVGGTKDERDANHAAAVEALGREVAKSALDYEEKVALAQARLDGVELKRQQLEDSEPGLKLADLADALADNIAVKGVMTESTLEGYRYMLDAFTRWMAEKHPEADEMRMVTDEIATEYLQHMTTERRIAGATYNSLVSKLKHTWQVFRRDRKAKLAVNPWEGVARRTRDTVVRQELTVEELKRICEAATGEMRVLVALGIYTGLRIGDAATLDWGRVDMVRGFVTATPRKTAKHGTTVRIPLHPTLRAILEELPGDHTGPILPESCAMYRHDASALSISVSNLFRKCGIKTNEVIREGGERRSVLKSYHSFRHTFVSLCANAGVPLSTVQEIVGHKSTAMTMHYSHVSDDALQLAIKALPDIGDEAATESPRIAALRVLLSQMDAAELAQAKALIRE